MSDRFDINYAYEILGLEPSASPAQVISPDGKTLVSGSRDMTIKLWRYDV
ncbi:MAG: hypothetical protein ACYTXC_08450 [Nostoc sp.]